MSISITITAENAAELKQELLILALARVNISGSLLAQEQTGDTPEAVQQPSAEAETLAEEKPKRTRRTKAQIAAEKAAEAAAPTPDKAEEAAPAATLQDVNKAMAALMETGPAGGGKMIDLLTELGARDESGAIKTKFLDEAKFAEAVEKANAMTVEAENAAGSTENVLG